MQTMVRKPDEVLLLDAMVEQALDAGAGLNEPAIVRALALREQLMETFCEQEGILIARVIRSEA
jgi:hypothetical protein